MNAMERRRFGGQASALVLGLASVIVNAAVAAEGAATASGASRAESGGVATGLALGAAAGGPFGAVLGAAAGAWFGDRYHLARETARSAGELQHRFGFRTASAELEPEAVLQLRRLAQLAAGQRDARVRIVGEADPRGDAAYNLELSRRRAQAVAAVFAEQGWPESRLIVEGLGAVGSSPGAAPDPDGYAFARRVTVTIESS
jgi:outer membrane protein OmpA-like peptidoglycan-associated protein